MAKTKKEIMKDVKEFKVGDTIITNFGEKMVAIAIVEKSAHEESIVGTTFKFNTGTEWSRSAIQSNLSLFDFRGGYQIIKK